jgi:hypothetical protein
MHAGIITEVTLKLQPGLLKTKLWGTDPVPDTNIADKLIDMIVSGAGIQGKGRVPHTWAWARESWGR